MKQNIIFLSLLLLSSVSFAGTDYCISYTEREVTKVTCPFNDNVENFNVRHDMRIPRITFAVGLELKEIQAEARAIVSERLFSLGYTSRGTFDNYGLYQRQVTSPTNQVNMLLVDERLKYVFIQDGGWSLVEHDQELLGREAFVNRVLEKENLSYETHVDLGEHRGFPNYNVIIYKVD